MSLTAGRLKRLADGTAGPLVLIEVVEARGSTPREAGAFMLVGARETAGTIGGGRLEFMAIARARALLGGPAAPLGLEPAQETMAVPLGPAIGQCCGGHVTLRLTRLHAAGVEQLAQRLRATEAAEPRVLLFGAGHVGQALAAALAPLPFRVLLVETRGETLQTAAAALGKAIETRLTAIPEADVAAAPAGSAFVILTHDHALDFLLASAALSRGDAAYVGMIGSQTKRATFAHQFLREGGHEAALARLVCPIGGSDLIDKRPGVIAALAAAEIARAVLARP